MQDPRDSFQSLEPEFRQAILIAEDANRVVITPLQQLTGGWSGASVYLVRVAFIDSDRVEHVILKLDHKRPRSASDEIARHQAALGMAPPGFAQAHIPDMAFDRVEAGQALAIFYLIAGQSLTNFRTLSSFTRQSRLESLFAAANQLILAEWNKAHAIEPIAHPAELLRRWLGYRLEPGQPIETFLSRECHLPAETAGFIVDGKLLPNPLHYARMPDDWGTVRGSDAAIGFQHGDLNTNNLLARFSQMENVLDGIFLIDFSLFKEAMPLFFDLRYLEMSYLVHTMGRGLPERVIELVGKMADHDMLPQDEAPIELAGVNAAIHAGRQAFGDWVRGTHPSLQDDLWGQYWLAGAAAGLNYSHKASQPPAVRLAGLVYSAANMMRYFKLAGLDLPKDASQLRVEGAWVEDRGLRGPTSQGGVRTPTNLPIPISSLVGRRAELENLGTMLQKPEVRLVSLTGPGGTGKTRLALEVGRALLDQFVDGVYFVDLAPITDPGLVVIAITHALGIREGGGRASLETLQTALASSNMLLILDNLEQVTGSAKDLSALLSTCSGLKLLITSRIPLHIQGEQEVPVAPLPIPPAGVSTETNPLSFDSVALFERRAKSVMPGFEVGADNREAVFEICRQLDGLPLAIEIAAARIQMLPPRQLLKRLDRRLDLLVGKAQDVPDRQRTMRGAIEWSYDLLQPAVKTVFARLGVFAGGFDLEAAEAVCSQMERAEVFSGVESLLENNMLRQVPSIDDEPRFEMLQILREYALDLAEAAGMTDELRRAHSGYYIKLALSNESGGVYGSESGYWLRRYEQEHDNLRLVLTWIFDHPETGTAAAIALMTPLTWFWYRHGHLQEGTEWTNRALELTESMGDSVERASALIGRTMLALWSGDLKVAESMGRKGLEMADHLRLEEGGALARLALGTTLVNQGRHSEAYPLLVDAVEMFDQQNNGWFKGTVLVHLANVSLGMGNPTEALQWLDTALPLLKETGDIWNMAFGMNNYGEVARVQGDYDRAEDYYKRTEALYQQADAKGDQARLVHTFGYIALHKGEFGEAKALFQRSLDDFRRLGNHRGIAECLAGLAGLGTIQGNPAWAVPLLSSADHQLEEIGGAWWPADRVEIDQALELMRSGLPDTFQALWRQGQSMSIEGAIEYASGLPG